jgi:hypothetical protein
VKTLFAVIFALSGSLLAQNAIEPDLSAKPMVIKQIGGLDIAKMEKVGAPAAAISSYMVVSAGKPAIEVAKEMKIPTSVAEELLKMAKSTPGQVLLAAVALGGGTIFVINQFGVPGSDGFFVVYKYWIALGAFLFGGISMAIYKATKSS